MLSDKCKLVSDLQGCAVLDCKEAPPLGEGGVAGEFEILSGVKGAFLVEVIADRGMDRGELLQGSHPSEPEHGALPSSERKMRVLRPVVRPATELAVITAAEVFQRSSIRAQAIGEELSDKCELVSDLQGYAVSGSKEAAPLGKRGVAVGLVDRSARECAFLVEVIAD